MACFKRTRVRVVCTRLDAKNKRGQTPLAIALLRIDRSNRQLRPETVAALKELDGGATPASTAETGSGSPASVLR